MLSFFQVENVVGGMFYDPDSGCSQTPPFSQNSNGCWCHQNLRGPTPQCHLIQDESGLNEALIGGDGG